MPLREQLQAILGATDEQMNVLLKKNAPDGIIERIIKLCEAVKEKRPDAVFGIKPSPF